MAAFIIGAVALLILAVAVRFFRELSRFSRALDLGDREQG